MNNSPVLIIDIGTGNIQATLFDVSGEQHQLLGTAIISISAGVTPGNLHYGVRLSIEELQANSGLVLLNVLKDLIQPINQDGDGVKSSVITISGANSIKVMEAGLFQKGLSSLDEQLSIPVDIQEFRRLDLRSEQTESVIDEIIAYLPDLLLLVEEVGSKAALQAVKLYDPVLMAMAILPENHRPEIVCIGSKQWYQAILLSLNALENIYFIENNSRSIDVGNYLVDLKDVYLKTFLRTQIEAYPELKNLTGWSDGNILPGATSFGEMIKMLGENHRDFKGVWGIDIKSTKFTMAADYAGKFTSRVYSDVCHRPGYGFQEMEGCIPLEDIREYVMSTNLTDELILAYIYNKWLYPTAIPLNVEELAVEHALIRVSLRKSSEQFSNHLTSTIPEISEKGFLGFEPILVSGDFSVMAPSLAHAVLILLDGIQPSGITTLVLDEQRIASALGAMSIAYHYRLAQVDNSKLFTHLASVIAPVGESPPGTPVLRAKIILDDHKEIQLDLKHGDFEVISLPEGRAANIHLQPFHKYDVGMGGPGISGTLRVSGSVIGVVLDCRGRPLKFSPDPQRRVELHRKWLWTLGGQLT